MAPYECRTCDTVALGSSKLDPPLSIDGDLCFCGEHFRPWAPPHTHQSRLSPSPLFPRPPSLPIFPSRVYVSHTFFCRLRQTKERAAEALSESTAGHPLTLLLRLLGMQARRKVGACACARVHACVRVCVRVCMPRCST